MSEKGTNKRSSRRSREFQKIVIISSKSRKSNFDRIAAQSQPPSVEEREEQEEEFVLIKKWLNVKIRTNCTLLTIGLCFKLVCETVF
jgi:hypothetical protein